MDAWNTTQRFGGHNSATNYTMFVDDTLCDVILEAVTLKWRPTVTTGPQVQVTSVLLDDVIAIKARTEDQASKVDVHYVSRDPSFVWSVSRVTFETPKGDDLSVTDLFVNPIQHHIDRLKRPKRLLVFVNPNGGARQGVSIYEQKAAPLFQLARVTTDVIITQSEKHASDVLSNYDFSTIDGLVSVGGDGTFMQCFNGLLQRMAQDAGIDLNDQNQSPVAPPIPIGIISSGSAQGLVWSYTLTRDPVTATLHIIKGETHQENLYSVHNAGRLLAFGGLLVSYGVSGDIFRASESMRYLGRFRYLMALAWAFYTKRTFNAKLYLKSTPDTSKVCVRGDLNDESQNLSKDDNNPWLVNKGSFCDVHVFLVEISPAGMIRRAKEGRYIPLSQDYAPLFLFQSTDECSRLNLAKSIINMYVGDDSGTTGQHTSVVEAQEAKIVIEDGLNDANNSLSIDGEVFTLKDPVIHVKGHLKLLTVFGAGYAKILGMAD